MVRNLKFSKLNLSTKLKCRYNKSTILILGIGNGNAGFASRIRACGVFQAYKDGCEPIPKLGGCTNTTITGDGPMKGHKYTICLCSEDFCNN